MEKKDKKKKKGFFSKLFGSNDNEEEKEDQLEDDEVENRIKMLEIETQKELEKIRRKQEEERKEFERKKEERKRKREEEKRIREQKEEEEREKKKEIEKKTIGRKTKATIVKSKKTRINWFRQPKRIRNNWTKSFKYYSKLRKKKENDLLKIQFENNIRLENEKKRNQEMLKKMEIEKNKTLQEKKENEKLFQNLYQQNKIEHDNRLKETEINYNKRINDLVNKSRQLELERKQKYDEQNRIHKETINQMYIDHRNNMDNLNTNFQKK